MSHETLFRHLSSSAIAELIRGAEGAVCYAAPGIQKAPAEAMAEVARRIGPEMLTVSLDFDERVMRMGYGDIGAIELLRDAGVIVNHSKGLRSGLVVVDDEGYTFTPTALYLEADKDDPQARNAMRLSEDQVAEVMARLSPAAKMIAIARTEDPDEKQYLDTLPVEVGSDVVKEDDFKKVDDALKSAPPVKFDVARQVRVFVSYLQYVELKLNGAAIQRHRLAIPKSIQQIGANAELEGRLRTTFDLIGKDSKLSSKALEKSLRDLRDTYTPSLGNDRGRVILKSIKPTFNKKIEEFRKKLEEHQQEVKAELQNRLDESRKDIIEYYLPKVTESPPDALLARTYPVTEEKARNWLDRELDGVFPNADSMIEEMALKVDFKDVTFETLNEDGFIEAAKAAFPDEEWDKAHQEFLAAGEND